MNKDDPLEKISLPNGATLLTANPSETAFVIGEIFQDQSYSIEGIENAADSIIVDVGANVGVFVHYVLSCLPLARVFAFEPAPPIFQQLCLNTEGLEQVDLEQVGLADQSGDSEFTYYPDYSILSGFQANRAADEELLRSGIEAQLSEIPRLKGRVTSRHVEALAQGRLDNAEVMRCPIKTLSQCFDEKGWSKVDFLKIDAERSELNILRGIESRHWDRVHSVGMEVHEGNDHSKDETLEILRILTEHGFVVTQKASSDQCPRTLLLYARRQS